MKTGGVPSTYPEHECLYFDQPGGDENSYKLEKDICCWDGPDWKSGERSPVKVSLVLMAGIMVLAFVLIVQA